MKTRQPPGRPAGTPMDENSSTSRGVRCARRTPELVREFSKQVMSALIVVFLAASIVPAPGLAQSTPPDPGLPGPFPVDQFSFTLQSLGATVFYPGVAGVMAAGGPFPGLVVGHGFARTRAQHANNGAFLASHGTIVVTVDFPNPLSPDFDAWAAQISAALDWMEAENVAPASRFHNQIDVSRFGVLGHSAGGMATWVAAGQDSRIKAIMPLDPVPGQGADPNALGAGLTMPSAWVAAPGSSCNASASYQQVYLAHCRRAKGPIRGRQCHPLRFRRPHQLLVHDHLRRRQRRPPPDLASLRGQLAQVLPPRRHGLFLLHPR